MIPDFGSLGTLPAGIHEAESWDEIVEAFEGTSRRDVLIDGLRRMLVDLAAAGCERAYLDGSFVTDKETPGDFDLVYEQDHVDDDKLPPEFESFDPDSRQRQKNVYGGEALPNVICSDSSQPFVEFFQNDKVHGGKKGIVAIDPRVVPHD